MKPKSQQQTWQVAQASKKYVKQELDNFSERAIEGNPLSKMLRAAFEAGAKWQAKQGRTN